LIAFKPLLRQFAFTVMLAASLAVHAQATFPNKPLRIYVGAPAGGGTDVMARLFSKKMSGPLGQAIIVDNRPGAANTIAADLTAKAPADGYTLLMATNSGQVIAPHLMKLSFDPLKQLTPVGMVMVVPCVLLVNAANTAHSFGELLADIKARPDAVRYASSGIGSVQHVAGEMLMAATGTRMTHIPYKGSSQAHQDILAGHVEVMLDTTSSAMPLIKAGKFRALAVTSPKRSAELPDVPTLEELGIRNADISTWYAMYVPTGTPAPVLERLRHELTTALQSPDVQSQIKELAGDPSTLTTDQFIALQAAEDRRFAAILKERHITLE
jgi:tripartite-type tricarboxylate transporter receptor subunit TctC